MRKEREGGTESKQMKEKRRKVKVKEEGKEKREKVKTTELKDDNETRWMKVLSKIATTSN